MGFGLVCDLETPVHGVVRGTVEVDLSLPLIFVFIDVHLFHRLFVVPDNVDFGDDGAVHGGIAIEILHELGVISSPGVRYCDESESV